MKRMSITVTAVATIAAIMALFPAIAAAQGSPNPDDRAVHGVGAIAVERTAVTSSSPAIRPDDRGGLKGVAAAEAVTASSGSTRPDDRGGLQGVGAFSTPADPGSTTTPLVVASSSEFDWSDAGIGAFGGAGLALLLVGGIALLATRRTGTRIALH
jgi:hypothetical protein